MPQKPQDLQNHRYIAHSQRKPDNELVFRHKEVVKVTPYIRVNDTEAMLTLALEDLGIVKLHHYVVENMLDQGLLIEVLASYAEQDIPLYVAFPQRRFLPSKVRCFIDFVVARTLD